MQAKGRPFCCLRTLAGSHSACQRFTGRVGVQEGWRGRCLSQQPAGRLGGFASCDSDWVFKGCLTAGGTLVKTWDGKKARYAALSGLQQSLARGCVRRHVNTLLSG